jgi:endonuclease III
MSRADRSIKRTVRLSASARLNHTRATARPRRSASREGGKRDTTIREVLRKLERQHPNADTELDHENPYQLLVATILSAQSTDAGVNRVTPSLFKHYPNAAALAGATAEDLEPQIRATGFFRSKARALLGMARALVERHNGEVPQSMDALVELPGVGRKTANVVLGHALGVPGLPVDRHVLRVSNRIGIADSEDPEVVEQQLGRALAPEDWTKASDTLILHGRRICKPKPLCDLCSVRADCDYFQQLHRAKARRRPGAPQSPRKKR